MDCSMARPTNAADVPPSIPATRALPLLRNALGEIPRLEALPHDHPDHQKWTRTTIEILHAAFGKPAGNAHANAREFENTGWANLYDPPDLFKKSQLRKRKATLESAIQQLEILAPPAAGSDDAYRFHHEIERVSGDLYRNQHYREAALNAFIRVIGEVRTMTGLPLDGDPLMNKAFGCDKQKPIIRFNSLASSAEVDEQRGFMNLFKGVVGQRNLKAHTVVLFDDPYRGHEYLALASLLMRVLEIAHVDKNP